MMTLQQKVCFARAVIPVLAGGLILWPGPRYGLLNVWKFRATFLISCSAVLFIHLPLLCDILETGEKVHPRWNGVKDGHTFHLLIYCPR